MVEPNRDQPRKNFDEDSLEELADSIKQFGLLQPIIVQDRKTYYEIIAGERRWRAARMLGLSEVPVQIREMDDQQAMQIALIENLQRENLNPVEEAEGYKDLCERFSMSHEDIAKAVGRSRSSVSNAVRLLSLPDEILIMLSEGDISTGHAKALLSFEDEGKMIQAARKAAEGKLNVRALEKLAKEQDKDEENYIKNNRIDSYFKEMEIGLHDALGRKVKVEYGKNKGALILEFYNKEDLAELAEKLAK